MRPHGPAKSIVERSKNGLNKRRQTVPRLVSIPGSPETVALVDSGTDTFEAVLASGENVFEGSGAGYPSHTSSFLLLLLESVLLGTGVAIARG